MTTEKQTNPTAFNEGALAHSEGFTLTDNPYEDGSVNAESWADGWNFSKQNS